MVIKIDLSEYSNDLFEVLAKETKDKETLKELLKVKSSWKMRLNIANNQYTGEDDLQILKNDVNHVVADAAKRNLEKR